MTTLYRPVRIESIEQAEALPINTLAISADGVDPAIRKEDGWHGIFGDPPYSHAEMVSDYALVPIEAEETRSEGTGWIVWSAFGPKLAGAYLGSPDGTPPKRYTQTTWRTPWEEV